MNRMSRAAALLTLALAVCPAGGSSFDIAVDPRFELLGVVSQLAGRGRAVAGFEEYRARVAKRFDAFRGHPAVELYKGLDEQAVATILIHYTAPPELALKNRDAVIHNLGGDAAQMQHFLWELRDFARASGFFGFFLENHEEYGLIENKARGLLGAVDPVAAIESYLGVSLASRSHYILTPPDAGTHAFIVPYPLPPAGAGADSFDIYTMSPSLMAGGFANEVWPEPLCAFIDPSFYYFEKLNIPDPEKFYGAEVARCRTLSPDCVKHFAVTAIIEHLNPVAGSTAMLDVPLRPALERRLVAALSKRLDEYEAHRDLYPTLWSFYPRWFAVFEEAAFPKRVPRKLSVPAEPKIRRTSEFLDPGTAKRLLRRSAK